MSPACNKGNYIQSPGIIILWGDRELGAWYIGPAWEHCRCVKFQVPNTGEVCVSVQYKLYPQHSNVPIETQKDEYNRIAKDLIEAVNWLQDREKTIQDVAHKN